MGGRGDTRRVPAAGEVINIHRVDPRLVASAIKMDSLSKNVSTAPSKSGIPTGIGIFARFLQVFAHA